MSSIKKSAQQTSNKLLMDTLASNSTENSTQTSTSIITTDSQSTKPQTPSSNSNYFINKLLLEKLVRCKTNEINYDYDIDVIEFIEYIIDSKVDKLRNCFNELDNMLKEINEKG